MRHEDDHVLVKRRATKNRPLAARPPPCLWFVRMGSPDQTGGTALNAAGCRVLLVIGRLLVLFLALHVSGVGPVLWGDCCSTDGDDCSGPTDRRQPCDDCPPGCPKCHCAPAPFSVPPAVETDSLDLHLLGDRVAWTPYEPDAPHEAPVSSIFRPPKLA